MTSLNANATTADRAATAVAAVNGFAFAVVAGNTGAGIIAA